MKNKTIILEAILFWRGEPVKISRLANILKSSHDEIVNELAILENQLSQRGVILIRKNDEVSLATTPEASDIIADLTKEEFSRDLGKAGLETLSVVLYRGPISRSEIDYIRGVNSTFILRNLVIRGLIEKITDEKDQRRYLYRPTFDLLGYLGLKRLEDLPEYDKVKSEIERFKEDQEKIKDKNDLT